MKANELRIGDWYKSVKFGAAVKCDLSDLYDLCAKSDGAYNDPPIDEMFEPIPLTEEWLLKFGFEKDKVFSKYSKHCGEYEMAISINVFSGTLERDASWFVSILTGYASQPVTLVKQYVHQVQNLYFALTGNELTIEK